MRDFCSRMRFSFDMMAEKYGKEASELQSKIDEAEQSLAASKEQEVNTEMFRGIISLPNTQTSKS